jgi:hypothetical protein
MKRRRLAYLALFIAAVAALAARTTILAAAGRILVAEDPISKADIVVVPEWAGIGGALEAVDLVSSGFATTVLVVPRPRDRAAAELARRRGDAGTQEYWFSALVRSLGVRAVVQLDFAASGTSDEGHAIDEWRRDHQVRSMIVVTTLDHSRRVRRALHRSLANPDLFVIVRATRYSEFNPEAWWQTHDGIRTELIEIEKLALDLVRHPWPS